MTRDLRLLSIAIALSAAGDMLLNVVLALRVHDLTGSGFAVAGLFAALMVPVVVLSSWPAGWSTGSRPGALLLLVSLAQAAVAGALVFADGRGAILVLTALLGARDAMAAPAEASLVPATGAELKARQRLGGIGAVRGLHHRAVARGVVDRGGRRGLGLAANAASFLVVALAAWLLHARRDGPGASVGAAAGCGCCSTTALRATLGAAVGALLFISASLTVELFYVRDVVGASQAGYSLVIAGWTGGMVLGAVGFASRVRAPLAVAGLPRCRAGARDGHVRAVAVLRGRSLATSSAASATASRTSSCAR